jgi:hypothetical protein
MRIQTLSPIFSKNENWKIKQIVFQVTIYSETNSQGAYCK